MEFNQLIVREFLKANPSVTDTPEVLRKELKGTITRGVLLWRDSVDADYRGTTFFNYEVPDLSKIFQGLGTIILYVWKPITNRDVAKALFEYYGLVCDYNDIVPTAISYNPLPDTVTLVASASATTVKGSVTIYLRQAVKDLADIITTTEVDALVDKYPLTYSYRSLISPYDDIGLVAIKKYYGFDFTEFRNYLKNQSTAQYSNYMRQDFDFGDGTVGPFINHPIIRSEMDAPLWKRWDSATDRVLNYNLIICIYNGPASGWPEANPAYDRVVVWKPRDAYSVMGNILMHYNL